MGNKFFLTREGSAAQKNESFHFATHLSRTLTIEEGRELRDLLTDLLGDKPNPVSEAPEPETPEPEASPKKNSRWGK